MGSRNKEKRAKHSVAVNPNSQENVPNVGLFYFFKYYFLVLNVDLVSFCCFVYLGSLILFIYVCFTIQESVVGSKLAEILSLQKDPERVENLTVQELRTALR